MASQIAEKYDVTIYHVQKTIKEYDKQQYYSSYPENNLRRTALSGKTVNALLRAGIETIDDLKKYFTNPYKIKYFNNSSMEECRLFLENMK
ncbi:MAG: hypothetical protein Q4E61_02830 [Alphaproteobacteria bacterium]|nr:hypothetical protein [Alphaproteobacteria bacterium]